MGGGSISCLLLFILNAFCMSTFFPVRVDHFSEERHNQFRQRAPIETYHFPLKRAFFLGLRSIRNVALITETVQLLLKCKSSKATLYVFFFVFF